MILLYIKKIGTKNVKKNGLFTLKTTAYIAALSLSTSLVYGADSSAEKSVSDLPSSLNEALNTNPEILFQKAEKDASDHKVTQSIGAYLPSVDLRAGYGREYIKQNYQTTNIALAPTHGSRTSTRYDPSVTVNQKVFDGLATPYDIQKSKKELFQSVKNLEEAQLLVAFDVFDKYIAVRRFERLVKLAKENVSVHQSILGKIKKLVKAGKATTGDEKNVQSRLYDAKAAVGDIQGDLETAYANFKETVGVEAQSLSIPQFNESLLPSTVQEAVAIATKKNRSVIVAKATEGVASSEFDKTIAPFMPSVDLQFQAKRNHNVAGKKGLETDIVGQVIGTFNVLNGGRDIGKRRELRAKMRSAKFRKQKEIRRAEKEVRVSYAEMVSARTQSKALRGAVTSKKDVRNIYMKQFEAGTRSFLDILDASHEFFLAKGSLITSDATEDLAAARLLASTGTLLEQFEKLNLNLDTANEEHKLDVVKQDEAVETEVIAENAPSTNESAEPKATPETVDGSVAAYSGEDVGSKIPTGTEREMAQASPHPSDVY